MKYLNTLKIFFSVVAIAFFMNACHHKNSTATYQKYDDFKTINANFKITSKAVVNGQLLPDYQCEKKINDIENSIPLS